MQIPALRTAFALAMTLALFACDKPIADRDAIFGAIHENVHAIEKKDVETVMATIHPDSPQLENTRAMLREMFNTVDLKFTLSDLRIISASPEEVKVSFVQKSVKVGGTGTFIDSIEEGVDTLRPDKGTWKIYFTLAKKITDLDGKPLFEEAPPAPLAAPPSTPAPAALAPNAPAPAQAPAPR